MKYASYVNLSSKSHRSVTAPPLLCVYLLDPEFKTGRDVNGQQKPYPSSLELLISSIFFFLSCYLFLDIMRFYFTNRSDFCDMPPVGLCLYPQHQVYPVLFYIYINLFKILI